MILTDLASVDNVSKQSLVYDSYRSPHSLTYCHCLREVAHAHYARPYESHGAT